MLKINFLYNSFLLDNCVVKNSLELRVYKNILCFLNAIFSIMHVKKISFKRNLFLLIAIILYGITPSYAGTVRHENIIVVVNNAVVTSTDIDARMRLIMTSSGLPDRPEVREKVRAQVTTMLIEEKIKTQEALRLKLSVDETDVDSAITVIAEQNKMTSDNFQKMLQMRGIKVLSLRDQIRAQILWGRVVGRQIKPQITIYDRDIDAELKRLAGMVGQTEYAVSEILLPTDRPVDEKNSRDLAIKIIPEIKRNPQTFSGIARQFSKAPGAVSGGHIGWVTVDQLGDDIGKIVKGSKPGSVLGPFKNYSGLHILFVHDVRTRTMKELPTRDDIQKNLFMERVDRLQNQYYLDLRSAAFINSK